MDMTQLSYPDVQGKRPRKPGEKPPPLPMAATPATAPKAPGTDALTALPPAAPTAQQVYKDVSLAGMGNALADAGKTLAKPAMAVMDAATSAGQAAGDAGIALRQALPTPSDAAMGVRRTLAAVPGAGYAKDLGRETVAATEKGGVTAGAGKFLNGIPGQFVAMGADAAGSAVKWLNTIGENFTKPLLVGLDQSVAAPIGKMLDPAAQFARTLVTGDATPIREVMARDDAMPPAAVPATPAPVSATAAVTPAPAPVAQKPAAAAPVAKTMPPAATPSAATASNPATAPLETTNGIVFGRDAKGQRTMTGLGPPQGYNEAEDLARSARAKADFERNYADVLPGIRAQLAGRQPAAANPAAAAIQGLISADDGEVGYSGSFGRALANQNKGLHGGNEALTLARNALRDVMRTSGGSPADQRARAESIRGLASTIANIEAEQSRTGMQKGENNRRAITDLIRLGIDQQRVGLDGSRLDLAEREAQSRDAERTDLATDRKLTRQDAAEVRKLRADYAALDDNSDPGGKQRERLQKQLAVLTGSKFDATHLKAVSLPVPGATDEFGQQLKRTVLLDERTGAVFDIQLPKSVIESEAHRIGAELQSGKITEAQAKQKLQSLGYK